MKTFSFDEIKDEFIGEAGTEKRELYERAIHREILGEEVKKIIIEALTQEGDGKRASQVSPY